MDTRKHLYGQISYNISTAIETTCKSPPIPTLTNLTAKQGGFMPRKLHKQWKIELAIY